MNFRRMASQWRSSSKRRLAELSEAIALPSLDAVEAHIRGNFGNGCFYCGTKLSETVKKHKIELDHKVPISRGGSAAVENLALSCHACNCGKGPLLASEWKSLLQLLDTWDPGAAQSLLVRLKGGYWVYRPTSDQRAAERRAVVKKALLNTPVEAPGSILSDPWPS